MILNLIYLIFYCMQYTKNKAFTLVELLVVITILAIISVVAYQNFWWAVDKAISGRKISDVSTIETSLQQYRSSNNYYPPVWEYDANTNMWWYTWSWVASKSNPITVIYDGQEIWSLVSWTWWWIVYWSWAVQIWAKWTIWKVDLWKFLSKDLYDPEVWDLKINSWWTMIDKWIWRYVYAVYKKSYWWPNNQSWSNYNIAFTIKKEWEEEWYVTKIVWDYDKTNYSVPADYPDTLIWPWDTVNNLIDWEEQDWPSNTNDYWVPYAVNDFIQ